MISCLPFQRLKFALSKSCATPLQILDLVEKNLLGTNFIFTKSYPKKNFLTFMPLVNVVKHSSLLFFFIVSYC